MLTTNLIHASHDDSPGGCHSGRLPFTGGVSSKVRPAVVVQSDRDNSRLVNTIVAMITSRTHRAAEPTQVLIQIGNAEGRQTGLIMDSVVNCSNLFTVEQAKVLRKLGRVSPALWAKVADGLKAAFDLS